MDHAITVGDLLFWIGIPAGLLLAAAIILGLIALLNPFRSGH